MAKKTWQEKLFCNRPSKIAVVPRDFADIKAGQTIIIPAFSEVHDYIRAIPRGERRNIKDLRANLAQKHQCDAACPIVSGMAIRIIAEYEYEQYQQGKKITEIAPFWRIIDEKAAITKKLTFDTAMLNHFNALAG